MPISKAASNPAGSSHGQDRRACTCPGLSSACSNSKAWRTSCIFSTGPVAWRRPGNAWPNYGYSRRLADDGAGYADVIVNPTHWPAWHGRLPDMIDAIDTGLAAAEQDGLPPMSLCVSLLRTQSSDAAAELVDTSVALRQPRVVALSIDGNEAAAGRTGPRFAQAFRRAGAAGLRRTVHAGESSGPLGMRDAIELLGADRIDHGVRAVEAPGLVALLVERRIRLGVCPTSNLKLGVYASIEDHPIDRLRRAGVVVSISTDDPVLLGAASSASTRCAARRSAGRRAIFGHWRATRLMRASPTRASRRG